jgi:hypothetical protein
VEPQLRASLLRLYLERLPSLDAEATAAARAALGAETIRRVERAAGHVWLPMAWELAILRAVHAARGDGAVRALGREVGRAALSNPILRPLVSAVLGMLGRRPEALVQLALAGWGVAVRDAGGAAIVARRGGELKIAYEGIPEVARHRAHLLRMCGSVEALLRSGGVDARVEIGEWTEGAARAVYVVSWTRRGGREGE